MRFIDSAIIEIFAGDGGNGSVSFRREKFAPRGGPDGGDGGRGGSVTIRGNRQLGTLHDHRYHRKYVAIGGANGKGSNWHGSDGESIVIDVPCGTEIFDNGTGEFLGDIVEEGQELVVAKGGNGGRGNARFATPTRQAPDFAKPGGTAEQRTIKLELKLLADVGLVGFPNAGKSTLLAAMSAARPKIADYPFTTLVPNLGIVELGHHRTCVMADIPGLIEGAHAGRGLGDQFLRHIERTRVLIFLVEPDDLAQESLAEGVILAVDLLRQELGAFDKTLLEKPWLVAVSKADLWPQEEMPRPPKIEGSIATLVISGVTGVGLEILRTNIADLLFDTPEETPDKTKVNYSRKLSTEIPDEYRDDPEQ